MYRRTTTWLILLSTIIVVVFFITASNFSRNTTSREYVVEEVTIYGSGSSLLYPQMQIWIREFNKEYPQITINYNPTGSGTGQNQFFQRTVDFAGSDPPLKKKEWIKYRGEVLQVPVIIGAVVVVYNIPGIDSKLKLDGETLAKIYKGEIKYWDDPLIKNQNPTIELPRREIVVVHRSDSSGTTNVFTLFLHKSAPHIWPKELVGKSIDWPIDRTGRGVGGKGNQGVAQQVKQIPFSIGYVELAYAINSGLAYAMIKNKAGYYVEPTTSTIMAAAEHSASLLPLDPSADWSSALNAIVYTEGRDSYPISTFSFLILRANYNDKAKAEALALFLEWIAEKGYNHVAQGYVALPNKLTQVLTKAAEILKGGTSVEE